MEGSFQSTKPASSRDGDPQRPLEYYNQAVQAIDLLYGVAVSGSDGAEEVLRDLAEKLTIRGGGWRQMKYLKK
ncbi:MAG: hypothetical protein ABSF14_01190 [Terriglobia bacterium]|jgi:3-deoxy-D-arabino-heptulosonate 7-phosphate (DAHP) synthase class II